MTTRPIPAGASLTHVLVAALLLGCDATAQPKPATAPEQTIPLANVEGRIDHMAIDAAANRLYVSGGDGHVSRISHPDSNTLQPLDVLATAPGARTATFSPDSGLLYVAVPHRGPQPSELRLYRVRN